MTIGPNSVVSIHYKVSTSEGEDVDASEPGHPLTYLHGHGQIIAGLEAALNGRAQGEHVHATLAPAQAYGEHDPELDMRVSKKLFPAHVRNELQPGFRFGAEHPKQAGVQVRYTVQEVEDDTVLVSGNHPLAGKTLVFQVDVAEVRAATEEELAHGHVHGPGGHHHH